MHRTRLMNLGLDMEPARLITARLVIARLVNEPAWLGSLYKQSNRPAWLAKKLEPARLAQNIVHGDFIIAVSNKHKVLVILTMENIIHPSIDPQFHKVFV